jgi:tripartite-type tricarboxylate transporter receptor subunit TctC
LTQRPSDIIEKLNKEINAALAEPALQLRLAELGSKPLSMTPSEFGKFVAVEIEKCAKVMGLRQSSIRSAVP